MQNYSRWNPVPDSLITQVIKLYKTGKTAKEVAAHYGLDNSYVGRILKRHNVTLHPKKIKLSPNQVKKIISCYDNKESIGGMEKRLLISESLIRRTLAENNIEIRRQKRPDAENIISLYNSGKTTLEIGKILDINYTRVWQILKERNIKLRKGGPSKLTGEQVLLVKVKTAIKSRMSTFLKNQKKTNFIKEHNSMQMIGCSALELKKHLESQFQLGMTWENHGLYGWHVDHIIPLSSAATIEELMLLFHYTNLQPLWAKDNLQKHAKLNWRKSCP